MAATKALIFDLCGVIVPLDYGRRYAMFEELSPFSAEEVSQRIEASGLVRGLDTGRLEPESFARRMAALLEIGNVGFEEFCRIWDSVFEPPDTLLPGEFLESLRGRRRMVLLSNTNPIHFPYIEEHYPPVRHFDEYVLSYQVGATKPSPEMYQEAVARAQCPAEECLFIDDLEANVDAARREGIPSVQFSSYDQLRRELAELLL